MARRHGRCPRGERLRVGVPHGHWKTTTFVGARTLYLYQNGKYTLYTIYTAIYADTIGANLTSGCTGLLTQDMIDLYDRTAVKTKVIVLPA